MNRTKLLKSLPLAAGALAVFLGTGALAASKIVTVVLSEEPDVIDPCESSRSNVGRIVKQNITETMTFIDPATGNISPKLATAWKQTNDLTWRISLRKGIKFHDGSDFNAETAVKAIKRTLNPKSDCETRLKFFGNIKLTPVVVDEYTIDLKSEKPQPILPTILGTMSIAGPNMQPLKGDRNPVGTGPFKFVKWVPGQEVTTERFEGYWGENPRPRVRGISSARNPRFAPPWSRPAKRTSRPTSRFRTRPRSPWTSATSIPKLLVFASTPRARRWTTFESARH